MVCSLSYLGTLHVQVHLLSVHDYFVPEDHFVETVLLRDVLCREVEVEGFDVPVEQGVQVSLHMSRGSDYLSIFRNKNRENLPAPGDQMLENRDRSSPSPPHSLAHFSQLPKIGT